MIKPQDKVFAHLITQLQRDLPLEPLTRLVNLAAIALGILRSKSLQVGQILTATPWAGTRASLKERVQRLLKNPSVTIEPYSEPVARRILTRLAAGGARIHLTGDRTEWGAFNILSVCVGVADLNLALYWAPSAAEPWYLMTTEPTGKLACASYARRFRIEEMFKDFKKQPPRLWLGTHRPPPLRAPRPPAAGPGAGLHVVAVVGGVCHRQWPAKAR